MYDFPYGYASGWYQFGWSGEFAPGTVAPVHYFDTRMVAYRTEGGTLLLSDATCPHFGAHLGYGGIVAGENIRCPFHGWTWDPDGRNVDIPYSAPERMKLRIRHYEVREVDGVALMWYGAGGEAPSWEPARLRAVDSDVEFYPLYPDCVHTWSGVKFPPQLPVENSGDAAHFRYVHLAFDVPEVDEWEQGDYWFETSFTARFGGHAERTWATPKGPVDGRIWLRALGIGITFGRIESFDTVGTLQTTTPVTRELSDHRSAVYVPRTRGDGTELSPEICRRWADQQFKQHARDFPVWENMTYIARPPFAATETTALRALRKWAESLYPENEGQLLSAGG
jgi:3-ketosteroid 9alpha-monooxygenase subunit A